MNPVVLQICLAIAMFLTTTVAGLLPFKVLRVISKKEKDNKAKNILTLLSCFAGGVFLGTCFLDIIPHVKGNYQSLLTKSGWHATYPFPEFFACFGFFLVYALEEITLRIFASGHHHSHGSAGLGHHHSSANGTAGPSHIESGAAEVEPLKPSNNTSTVSCDSTDTYMAVQTHEKVMDETVNYMSSTSNAEGGLLKSITFAVAMSFHSILEGFALGVQDDSTGIMTLFISLMIHKGVEAFSVGLQISRSNAQRFRIVLVTVTIYALMTPVGSMIGVIIQNLDISDVPKEASIVILEGMAAGTFIYVTFFEVLAQERANDYSNLKQLYAIIGGFLVIATLQINEHFVQGHSHGGH